jgi:hypothetical protein
LISFFIEQDIKKDYELNLQLKYNQISTQQLTITNISSTTVNRDYTLVETPTLFSIFNTPCQNSSSDEISEYLKEGEIEFNCSPFDWWNYKKSKYPLLAKLARQYLSVSATSTPSERLFSHAGNLLTAKRSRLDLELFKRMLFLKRNASCLKCIHPMD